MASRAFVRLAMCFSSMRIEKVQFQDLEPLRSFAERTFRIAYEKENDPVRFAQYCEKSFSPDTFKREWEHPHSEFWMAWESDILVAYLKLNYDQHPDLLESQQTVQVERLYVEPEFQGRRIGEKMLAFAYDQAKKAGAAWLWLSVWQARPAALRFYERCGYEIFGTETFWLADEAQTDWLVRRKVV